MGRVTFCQNDLLWKDKAARGPLERKDGVENRTPSPEAGRTNPGERFSVPRSGRESKFNVEFELF
jgi:hypothetical protein